MHCIVGPLVVRYFLICVLGVVGESNDIRTNSTWELFWLSMLLQIIAGGLLGISPEVFFNLKQLRFSPKEFIVLAILPILGLVSVWGYYIIEYVRAFFHYLPEYYIEWTLYNRIGPEISSIWLGIAIGKAFHIRQ